MAGGRGRIISNGRPALVCVAEAEPAADSAPGSAASVPGIININPISAGRFAELCLQAQSQAKVKLWPTNRSSIARSTRPPGRRRRPARRAGRFWSRRFPRPSRWPRWPFIRGCYDLALHASPRQDEWFGWAPQPARFWLLNLLSAPTLGLVVTGLPLILYFSFPRRLRSRFPLKLGFGGSPPLLGAALFTAFSVLCIAAFIFVASFED